MAKELKFEYMFGYNRGRVLKLGLTTLFCAALLAISQMASAQQLPNEIKTIINNYTSDYGGEYTIGVDDQVSINVWRNPDLSISVPVRPDGKVSAPLIGDVQAVLRQVN